MILNQTEVETLTIPVEPEKKLIIDSARIC